MGLFSKKNYCFKDTELTEKVPQNLVNFAIRFKAISQEEVRDIKAILCTPAKDSGPFILATKTDLIYLKRTFAIVVDRYPIASLTSVTMQTKKLLMYLVLTIGGSQTIFTDIYGDVEDLNIFISSISIKNASSVDTTNNSIADNIREYKKLLDDGLINEEEYEAKKKQLLGL